MPQSIKTAFPSRERQRGGGFAAKKEANPASLRSAAPSKGRGLRGYSLLPMEGGAPKGRRLDGESGMKKSGERSSQASHERKYPSAAVVNGDTQKREIFFVCGQTKNMRSADDGKRRDPHISGLRYFMRELQQKKARGVCQTQAPRAFFNRSPHPPA